MGSSKSAGEPTSQCRTHPKGPPCAPQRRFASSLPRALGASGADENGCARWYRLAPAPADHGRSSSGVTNPHSSLTGASSRRQRLWQPATGDHAGQTLLTAMPPLPRRATVRKGASSGGVASGLLWVGRPSGHGSRLPVANRWASGGAPADADVRHDGGGVGSLGGVACRSRVRGGGDGGHGGVHASPNVINKVLDWEYTREVPRRDLRTSLTDPLQTASARLAPSRGGSCSQGPGAPHDQDVPSQPQASGGDGRV